ncbi:uncharacterized protein LOC135370867 [Ornithodoros turicata]|uniref:uncharacterized protein LOC135370867 n=1 Tax=Ornithodoros turicata TaxID=34597 RepID=UPI003139B63E
MRKQSYYVWFLGAKESRGLRGVQYIAPVLRFLLDRERELEPAKVTLQVSSKGVKMVQNVSRGRGKLEQVKHFIPQQAVTCAHQEEDVVCAILLLYNPVTHCPVHVHAYRCDSPETAAMLKSQLQQLSQRPENQTRFRQIEHRLAAKGLLPETHSPLRSSRTRNTLVDKGVEERPFVLRRDQPRQKYSRTLASDGRTDDGSDHNEELSSSPVPSTRQRSRGITSLYDSLAAELREKLGNPQKGPLLLPPKDYDTVSRRQGDLKEVEHRRCTQRELVGARAAKPRESGSSGKSSSGISSDVHRDWRCSDEEEQPLPPSCSRRNILQDPRFRALEQRLTAKILEGPQRKSIAEAPAQEEGRLVRRPVESSQQGHHERVGARRKVYADVPPHLNFHRREN